MFQPKFDDASNANSSGRFGKLAFVVSEPTDARSSAIRSDREDPRQGAADEDNKWLSERLMACYND